MVRRSGSRREVRIVANTGAVAPVPAPTEYVLTAEHRQQIATTIDHGLSEDTRKDYRSRLSRIIHWLHDHYPDFCDEAVRPITEEDKNNSRMHFHKATEDFIYPRIDAGIVLAFLCSQKKKATKDGKIQAMSFINVRKYHDAILFGASERDTNLPATYHDTVPTWLDAFKKETTVAKQAGEMDKHDADPMTFPMYCQLSNWAVKDGDIFLWVYLVLLWNCMGRSASIDPLSLHNFRTGTDSIIIKFDNTKTDGTGDHVKPKNCYSNPYSPEISSILALGMWFLLYPDQYIDSDKLFIKTGSEKKSATKRYSEQLNKLTTKYENEIAQWSVPARIKAHSARKGAATYLTTTTLNPPPTSSISHRGEWTQGRIQDIYFNFAMPGDQYCGRMLAGMDSNDPSFQVLPPHFTVSAENTYIQQALSLCFGTILRNQVHVERAGNNQQDTEHAFCDRNTNAYSCPRGVKTVKGKLRTFFRIHCSREDNIKAWVKEAIQENDETNGVLSFPVFRDAMQDLRAEITALRTSNNNNTGVGATAVAAEATTNQNFVQVDCDMDAEDMVGNVDNLPLARGFQVQNRGDDVRFRSYYYGNKFWHVPKDWKLPTKISLRNAFVFWMKGQTWIVGAGNEGTANEFAPIRPFRKFENKHLPVSDQSAWRSGWKPVCEMILSFVDPHAIPRYPRDITQEQIDQWYEIGIAGIKQKVTYISINKYDIGSWKVTTWSKHISNNYIEKYGNEEDKRRAQLVRTVKMRPKQKRQAEQAQVQEVEQQQANRNVRERVGDVFGDVFAEHFEVTAEDRARATEHVDASLDEEVRAMFQVRDREKRTESNNPGLLLRVPTAQERTLPDATRMSSATYGASVVAMLKDDNNADDDTESE